MKSKKSLKLSLNKVTVSDLSEHFMIGIRGGKADDNQIAAATARYTNCDLCGGSTAMPVCSTYSLYPTCGDSCVEPPLACAKPVDDAIY